MYAPGDAISITVTTRNTTTGVAANADSLPTTTIKKNGVTASPNWTTVTLASTGIYTVTGTIPTTYSLGDNVAILLTATVNTVTDNSVIWEYRLDAVDTDLSIEVGNGISTTPTLLTFGPFATDPRPDMSRSTVAGVVVDVYQGNAPATSGGGDFTGTSDVTGKVNITFTPGTSVDTWWVREMWPVGTKNPAKPTFTYVCTYKLGITGR